MSFAAGMGIYEKIVAVRACTFSFRLHFWGCSGIIILYLYKRPGGMPGGLLEVA